MPDNLQGLSQNICSVSKFEMNGKCILLLLLPLLAYIFMELEPGGWQCPQ